jgi:uncharacterized membrane protein YbhN (UPF0104 family)
MGERPGQAPVRTRAGAALARLRRSRVVSWGLPLPLVALAIPLLRSALPAPAAVIDALHAAKPGWLAAAALAELLSLDMFARQQRRLLRAFETRMSQSRAIALTFSRTAITHAVPAGSAVSAAFAFGEFRSCGVSRSAAAAVTLLSGLASTLGLMAVYAVGALGAAVPAVLTRAALPGLDGPVGAELAGLVATLIAVGWLFLFTRRAYAKRGSVSITITAGASAAGGTARRWPPLAKLLARLANARAWLQDALRQAGEVPRRHWHATLALAAANWLADMLCLMAVSHALRLEVGVVALGSAYLTVQVARQIPVTPGGIGLVEAGLMAALVSAGAGGVTAAAVVLGYRMLSCWLVIPIGMLTWFALHRGSGPGRRVPPRRSAVTVGSQTSPRCTDRRQGIR